jgi:hypothetical protein
MISRHWQSVQSDPSRYGRHTRFGRWHRCRATHAGSNARQAGNRSGAGADCRRRTPATERQCQQRRTDVAPDPALPPANPTGMDVMPAALSADRFASIRPVAAAVTLPPLWAESGYTAWLHPLPHRRGRCSAELCLLRRLHSCRRGSHTTGRTQVATAPPNLSWRASRTPPQRHEFHRRRYLYRRCCRLLCRPPTVL